MRTINGLDIKEILIKLAEKFPIEVWEKHKGTNFHYLPVSEIQQRLDTVVGIENYNFMVTEPQLWSNNGKESCVIKGSLTIYDDDGRGIIKESPGAAFIIIEKTSQSPTSISNVVESAAQDAFKRCAKKFGIKGEWKEKERDEQKEGEMFVKLVIKTAFQALPKGGAKVDTEIGELVIWKKQWEMLQQYEQFRFGKQI